MAYLIYSNIVRYIYYIYMYIFESIFEYTYIYMYIWWPPLQKKTCFQHTYIYICFSSCKSSSFLAIRLRCETCQAWAWRCPYMLQHRPWPVVVVSLRSWNGPRLIVWYFLATYDYKRWDFMPGIARKDRSFSQARFDGRLVGSHGFSVFEPVKATSNWCLKGLFCTQHFVVPWVSNGYATLHL